MVIVTAALFACLLADDTYDLAYKPTKGAIEVLDYSIEGKDPQLEWSVAAVIERKVESVEKDGSYTVSSKVLTSLLRMAGSDFKDDRQQKSIATFDARGGLMTLKTETKGVEPYRNALLAQFVRPPAAVKMKGTWKSTFEHEGMGKTTIDYTLASVEGGVTLVSFDLIEAGEAGQRASGTWLIDAKSGVPQNLEAKVTNYLGSPGSSATITVVRRKPA